MGVSLSILASCQQKQSITNNKDYSGYLRDGVVVDEVKKINGEISFWQRRLQMDTGSYVNMLKLASNHLRLFKLSGNIQSLRSGDSLLKASSAKLNNKEPEILYSLSQASITQHQFLQAAAYTEVAGKANGDLYTIRLLEFDASMELGKYREAYQSLESLKDKSGFDYLIRKAKWEDYRGNLDEAILLMEKAFLKIENKNKDLTCWALSNLGDMYGHAGRIQESYQSYLNVLQMDPSNLYCLKGIAWIAYSHDGNTAEAKRILDYILTQTEMPDLKLVLAQIAESEGNTAEKQRLLNEFVATVTKPGYGDMYNKYLIEIYSEEWKEYDRALVLAEKELQNRFTPETCDWVAWTLFNKGDLPKALEYAKGHVYKRTFEPGAVMHTAFIYAANGNNQEAKKMLEECLESSFELGPVATLQLKEKLRTL